ncbi:TonB-dependent receptor plug domain-containing protein [Terrimonas pollutisoli]|uniref:TonB-dependent receptor plug domain-containing protein n=1 Tax=Terrimonas pollutisoli TaxID=3034147 RepID=UPI0023EA81B5|nr:TonB-dependent receptor plug domain-containing protein [Terrimonas sp. H1YJ31]
MKRLVFVLLLIIPLLSAVAQKQISRPKTKAEILNEKYCSALFSTIHGDYFDFLDEAVNGSASAYFNILDWLQGRVAGLQVYTTRFNSRIPFIRNQRAVVYVDEMRVDYDYLNALPVADIAMIKVIKGPSVLPFSGGGVIAVYTIRGEDEEETD